MDITPDIQDLRRLQAEHKITDAAWSRESGIHQTTFHRWWTGKVKPTPRAVEHAGKALRVLVRRLQSSKKDAAK